MVGEDENTVGGNTLDAGAWGSLGAEGMREEEMTLF